MAISTAFEGSWFHWFAPSPATAPQPADPFKATLDDAETLLSHAAESGADVTPETVTAILDASAAADAGRVDTKIRTDFYAAYAHLAKQFGEVTASTIRSCASMKTKRTSRGNRIGAWLITGLVASVSVATFMADSMSSGIVDDITTGNADAARLRVALTPAGSNRALDASLAREDPCTKLATVPSQASAIAPNLADIEALQQFAVELRDLHGRALKLNWLVSRFGMSECDPFGACQGHPEHVYPDEAATRAQTQINPAILNYDAEVLCKIGTFQTIRGFASNIRADYLAVMGAITAYALPIAYAWLGAYAFRLRAFAETIRRRTYHPSFADSARMVTAVIAGAIVGLFRPAQGLALSPLAIAFLAGYGVELFFKFLDTLVNAFGSQAARPAK